MSCYISSVFYIIYKYKIARPNNKKKALLRMDLAAVVDLYVETNNLEGNVL